MQQLLNATRQSVRDCNWFAATALSLMIPDVCGWLDTPSRASWERYAAWFDAHVRAKYVIPTPPRMPDIVQLSGEDCYALRCALLHSGITDLGAQKARQVVSRVRFVTPAPNTEIRISGKGVLLVDVGTFSENLCTAAEAWLPTVTGRADVASRLASMLTVESLRDGFKF